MNKKITMNDEKARKKIMAEYKLKVGKVGEKVVEGYKKVEEKFMDKFLEKDETNPSGYSLKTGKVGEKVTQGYQKVEDTVVGAYKKVENGFVDTFLEKVEPEQEDKEKNKESID